MGFRNSSGVVTLNPWSEGLARRDLIGIAMFDGGTGCTVPFGGTRGVFGTLPLAYAVPTEGEPVALDMAMTEIPFFQIKQAKEKGSPSRRAPPSTGAACRRPTPPQPWATTGWPICCPSAGGSRATGWSC